MINGIINIHKEAGFTSHDVVAKLRGILKQKKIGHTGTLDPDATGVLPVCLGSATKLCDLLTDKDKEYVAEIILGVTTDTEDISGTILTEQTAEILEAEFTAAALSFIGNYSQIPPMYSAIKVNGQKLYELARNGEVIERKPREVVIHEIEIISMSLPKAELRIKCSKGTYIRSLCRDIGDKLGCGACMGRLVRTRSGKFPIEEAMTLKEVENCVLTGTLEEHIVKTDQFFCELPAFTVTGLNELRVRNGNMFQTEEPGPEGDIRVYLQDQIFAGIYTYNSESGYYHPVKMFLNGV